MELFSKDLFIIIRSDLIELDICDIRKYIK